MHACCKLLWPILATLCLLLAAGSSNAQAPLELGDAGHYDLARHVSYRHDIDASDDPGSARMRALQGEFHALPNGNAAFGFQPGAYWFHARLINRNPQETRWLLVQQYALSDHIDVYLRHGDGRLLHQVGGDALPFSARSLPYRHPNFWLHLPPDEPVELLVRIRSQSSMQVPLSLYTPSAFIEAERDAQFGIGLYYGILLALFVYNLVMWISVRDSSYFWYLLHIGAFGLVLFTLNGLGFEYLWPRSPWLADKSVPMSICLAQIGMQQFSRTFLGLRERWPIGDRIGLALIGFFVLLGVAATQLPYNVSTPLASAAVLANIVWIAVEIAVAIRRGYQPAKLFLLAWSMFLLGTAMFTAIAFALLPKTFVTEYGVQIGSALEMLLLSVALGYRYAVLRNQNEQIVRDAKDQLEQKVQMRTRELLSALHQLENAHDRLRESSQRDSLTGLHNRSYFHEALQRMVNDHRGSSRPVSLLILDLDHFKRVNDHYGHLAGDECLRWAARTLRRVLMPHGALIARFGGEEFVVALPDQDATSALEVAEALRMSLRARPFQHQQHQICCSVSIGVHRIDIDHDEPIDAAFQLADQALYRAKAEGRDCVRCSALAA